MLWILQTIIEEKKGGRRAENYSCAELARKVSPLGIMKLRRLAILGLDEIVEGALAVTSSGGDGPAAAAAAMRFYRGVLKNVGLFHSHFHVAKTEREQQAEEGRLQALPPWFAESFLQLACGVHRGKFDKIWSGFLAAPPRGGAATITFAGHLSVPTGPGNEVQKTENTFVQELVTLRGECAKWKESVQKTTSAGN